MSTDKDGNQIDESRVGRYKRYRSRPPEVEAIPWTGFNWKEVHAFCRVDHGEEVKTASTSDSEDGLPLQVLVGKGSEQEWISVPPGHWLVRAPGDTSDVWAVDPVFFAHKYSEVRE